LSKRAHFAHRVFRLSVPAQAGTETLEQQQVALLEILRRAAGAPVGYGELHDAGIEFPAGVVSELELAGVAIDRCRLDRATGAHEVGVRLDPSDDPLHSCAEPDCPQGRPRADLYAGACAEAPSAHPDPYARTAGTLAADLLDRGADFIRAAAELGRVAFALSRALTAVLSARPARNAALFIALAVLVLAVLGLTGGRKPAPRSAARLRDANTAVSLSSATARARGRSGAQAVAGAQTAGTHTAVRLASRQAPTPVSATLATQLEARGHELLEAGQYHDAIPVLMRAASATGERLNDCREPVSETCLTYAYALYDLGRALLLSGQPQAAVPVLRRRLQIDNQRPTVESALALARSGRTSG
jgi:hypothetical protein